MNFSHIYRGPLASYLYNSSNKDDIMKNFAQVVIYNSRLSVTRIEEEAAYSLDALFSDIGQYDKQPAHWTPSDIGQYDKQPAHWTPSSQI